MALRAYRFSFKGLALGGEAVVLAYSLDEAKTMVKQAQPYDDVAVVDNVKGEPLTSPKILHSWNGDY